MEVDMEVDVEVDVEVEEDGNSYRENIDGLYNV